MPLRAAFTLLPDGRAVAAVVANRSIGRESLRVDQGWVTGIDGCGSLAMVRSLMISSSRMRVEFGRWTSDGWSAFHTIAEGHHGFFLFSGRGQDGSWQVGWSGFPEDQPEPVASIFLVMP